MRRSCRTPIAAALLAAASLRLFPPLLLSSPLRPGIHFASWWGGRLSPLPLLAPTRSRTMMATRRRPYSLCGSRSVRALHPPQTSARGHFLHSHRSRDRSNRHKQNSLPPGCQLTRGLLVCLLALPLPCGLSSRALESLANIQLASPSIIRHRDSSCRSVA